MPPERLDTFLHRAQDFSRSMKLLRDDDFHTQSAALLAIHAAIAYADALRTGLGDESLASEDHQTAVHALRSRLRQDDDLGGVSRYQKLLGEKSSVAYGPKRLDVQKLRLLCVEAERFAVWANRLGNARIAGWRNDHD